MSAMALTMVHNMYFSQIALALCLPPRLDAIEKLCVVRDVLFICKVFLYSQSQIYFVTFSLIEIILHVNVFFI